MPNGIHARTLAYQRLRYLRHQTGHFGSGGSLFRADMWTYTCSRCGLGATYDTETGTVSGKALDTPCAIMVSPRMQGLTRPDPW